MWYEKAYRRHLCDMHVADWSEDFLSQFDPEVYVTNLKRAHITSAMLYFQSHVGLCYYPTKSGKMHAALKGREDTMRRLVSRCHEEGIAVTGYYSLIYNTWAHDAHPDWRLVDENGVSKREACEQSEIMEFTDSGKSLVRYGFCCPNNPDYLAFTKTQIEEMATYFPDVDGMFYDMLFWPHMCHCEHCRARWEREVGGEMPRVEDWKNDRWLLYIQKRREWMGGFAQWVTDLTKALLPNVSVEHNVAYSALPRGMTCNCEEVIAACDYAGGDLYRGLYGQSFACKFYRNITKHQPFEYMFSRCAPNLAAHTNLKPKDVMRSTVFLTAAHHGATLVIDAIDPVGTMDERVYHRMGEVFGEMIPYESSFHGEMLEDVGVYYSLKSKFNADGERYTNHLGTVTSMESMIADHITCGVTGGFHRLEGYQAIIASCLTEEDSYDADRICDYVRAGGTLYFSGSACKTLLKRFFEAEITGRTEEQIVYLAPKTCAERDFEYFNATYPLHFGGHAPIAEGIDQSFVIATVTLPYTRPDEKKFASIHSNPPGIATEIPAMAARDYGKGRVIWSALPIECMEIDDYRRILRNLIKHNCDWKPTLRSDAPDDVEMTVFADEDCLLVHTVQLNTAHTARKLADFSVSVHADFEPRRVLRLPSREPITYQFKDHTVTFDIKEPRLFETFEIQKK